MKRPYVIVSCAQTLDGYLDDTAPERLMVSNAADFDRVDELRARVDAILVGAGTVRIDNPRLMVRSEARRQWRTEQGLSPTPTRVVLAGSLNLPADAALFGTGEDRLVYCPAEIAAALRRHLGETATVVGLKAADRVPALLADLAQRGVRRLMVEGGSEVLTQFLAPGLADELQLATAGFFVGEAQAPRLVKPGRFVWDQHHRLVLQGLDQLGDISVARYVAPDLDAMDRRWMDAAFEESRQCPPSTMAYAVGAIVVDAAGRELARGFSRETDDKVHAEEAALAKVSDRSRLRGATIYSTLEPCSKRASRPKSCTDWILETGVNRVVYALEEPLFFQDCDGAERLAAGGVLVRSLATRAEYATEFRRLNEAVFRATKR